MRVGVGYCDNPDSTLAGRLAARQAIESSGRTDECDIALLFCTARHNPAALRSEVAKAVGENCRIYGGGAAGIITNDKFGYAGDQVGVACIWLDGSGCDAIIEGGLPGDEIGVGERLGERLAEGGVSPDKPVMLFYDAIDKTKGDIRLNMATWLLAGIEKRLGFLPNLMGAGMQGDHICTPTKQFIGGEIGENSAFALTFSDDIHIDNVILHGCRPASPYYTVTKADGPVILEIDGRPAISFVDGLLGPSVTPEQYPFFLLFGINHGGADEEYDEKNYASRLCFGLDRERGGIVMFEPDMVAGTRFQIMCRSLELDYMRPKIEGLLNSLEDREIVFAMYIDCAGRCAGYGGDDIEDALELQAIVQDKFPILGLYTGVEIARAGGKPRGLDWTGVFCVFSKSKDGPADKKTAVHEAGWDASRGGEVKALSASQLEELCVKNLAKLLSTDSKSIAIRNELEQKRRGFSLLSELSVSLRGYGREENIFFAVAKRINAVMNMQKTVLLMPGGNGKYLPSVLQGYTVEERAELVGVMLDVDIDMLDTQRAVLVTAADDASYLKDIRSKLGLPYFISVPVVVDSEIAAILITGRLMEAPPLLSRLGGNETETLQAIAALLASTMVYQKLDEANRQARSDVLTGLYNRGALEQKVTQLLRPEAVSDTIFAFLLIDLDNFKDVNDSYGHIVGDNVLKALADTLRAGFRSTDIISRLGGDEFVVFCTSTGGIEGIQARTESLVKKWSEMPMRLGAGEAFRSTMSVGISVAPVNGMSYNELLHKADVALYKTKDRGRNGYTLYDEETMSI